MDPGNYTQAKATGLQQLSISRRMIVHVAFKYRGSSAFGQTRPELDVCIYQNGQRIRDANNWAHPGLAHAWEFPASTGFIEFGCFFKQYPNEEYTWNPLQLLSSSGSADGPKYDFDGVSLSFE